METFTITLFIIMKQKNKSLMKVQLIELLLIQDLKLLLAFVMPKLNQLIFTKFILSSI